MANNQDYSGNNNSDVSQTEIFMAFFGYIQRHLKCLSMGFVKSYDRAKHTVSCELFPIGEKEQVKQINPSCFSNSDFDLLDRGNKLVLVGMCDRSFRMNALNFINTDSSEVHSDSSEMHSEMNGIVIRVFDTITEAQ